MPDDQSIAFRRTMGRFATGVAVVLAGDIAAPVGMTVNSLASVSLAPPLILFCARHGSHTLDAVIDRGVFSVNILARVQRGVSNHFAGKLDGAVMPDYERHGPWHVLPQSIAVLFCDLEAAYPGGDHTIVLGHVKELRAPPAASDPLLFFEGRYKAISAAK